MCIYICIYIYIHPEELGGSIGFFPVIKTPGREPQWGLPWWWCAGGNGQPSSWRNPKSSDRMAVEIQKNVNEILWTFHMDDYSKSPKTGPLTQANGSWQLFALMFSPCVFAALSMLSAHWLQSQGHVDRARRVTVWPIYTADLQISTATAAWFRLFRGSLKKYPLVMANIAMENGNL